MSQFTQRSEFKDIQNMIKPTVNFYEDKEKTILKKEFLTDEALKWAKEMVRDNLSPNQIRKYYSEVVSLKQKIEGSNIENFKQFLPLIRMIKSKVSYSYGKEKPQDRKKWKTFKKFIEEMIDSINNYQDFFAFCLFFESILGYYYGEKADKDEENERQRGYRR